MLFETRFQVQTLIPLVTSNAFCLMSTTLMIIFIIPALFTILDNFNLTSLVREHREIAITVRSNTLAEQL